MTAREIHIQRIEADRLDPVWPRLAAMLRQSADTVERLQAALAAQAGTRPMPDAPTGTLTTP